MTCYQLAPANKKVQAILIMQGCQMALPLGKVARYDAEVHLNTCANIYHNINDIYGMEIYGHTKS